MKAAVIVKESDGKHLQVRDIQTPIPVGTQVRVQVTRVGVCGSDTHGFLDTEGTSRAPGLAMGHEIAGIVVELGPDAQGLAVGQRVAVDPQVVCGRCEPCRMGWISICDEKRVLGSSLRGFEQGGMAEFVVAEQDRIHPVPDSVDDTSAALVEPLANALHTVERAEPSSDDVVVVLGMGPLGLCMLQCLRAQGVHRVLVTDTSADRRDLALRLGAAEAMDPMTEDVVDRVRRATGGRGADVVIESVGIEETYRQAIAMARKRGRVMFFGAVTSEVTLPLLPILHKELSLIGCTGANDETEHAIALLASGQVDLSTMVGDVVPLDAAETGIRAQATSDRDAVKLVVDPSRRTPSPDAPPRSDDESSSDDDA